MNMINTLQNVNVEQLDTNVSNVLNVIKERTEHMLNVVSDLDICSEQTFDLGTKVWYEAKELRKRIEHQRKEATEPFRKLIAKINEKAKEISEPLDNVENVIKEKVQTYQNALKEAAEIIGTYDTNVQNVQNDLAITYKKVQKRFKVIDKTLIPIQYLCADEVKIEESIKAGIINIPGIEIYEEEKTIIRSRS
jgi:hypothetical protein